MELHMPNGQHNWAILVWFHICNTFPILQTHSNHETKWRRLVTCFMNQLPRSNVFACLQINFQGQMCLLVYKSISKVKCVCLSPNQFNAESQSMCIHAYVHLHFMQCVEVPLLHTQHAWSTCNFCGWCNSFSLNAANFHALDHFSNPSLSS